MRQRILLLLVGWMTFLSGWSAKQFTLVIDPGHGGHDAGAIGAISKEKNINLKVALAFGRYVERNCPDVKVIYTRKTDVFISLKERANIANRNKADLFISVHTNSLPAGRIARGFETYTLGMHRAKDNLDVAKRENSVISMEKDYKQKYQGFDPNSSESYIMFEFIQDKNMEKSVELAKLIQRNACATAGRNNKGVHQAGFLVLRETSMPSCLIELGFISTPDEERQLNQSATVDLLGKGIYQAFLAYKKKYGKTGAERAINVERGTRSVEREKKEVDNNKTVDNKVKTDNNKVREERNKVERAEKKKTEKKETVSQRAQTPVQTPVSASADQPKAVAQTEKKVADTIPQSVSQPVQTMAAIPAQSARTAEQPARQPVQTATQSVTPSAQPVKQAAQPVKQTQPDESQPVFKVQILACSTPLKKGDARLKGVTDATPFQENNMVKYTCGASNNYNEIYRLRKQLLDRFPEAFIIAFKNGEKMNVVEAVREFKANRNKQ